MVRLRAARKGNIVVTVVVVAFVAAVFYWGYFVPLRQNDRYNAALNGGMNTLMDKSGKLLDTDSLPLFNDISLPLDISTQNAATVTQAVSQFTEHLDALDAVVRVNNQQYLFGLSKSAALTRAHRLRAQAAVSQSRQVLAAYLAEATFLQALAQVRNDFAGITERLTTTEDINSYVNRSDELRGDAESILLLATRLSDTPTPPEFTGLRDQIVAQYKETAAGYTDLAYGIDIAVDDTIYGAARRVENAIHVLDTDTQNQFSNLMSSTNTMKQLGQLPDKYIIE